MSEEVIESWQHKIASMAKQIAKAETDVVVADAECKKLSAVLEVKAMGEGFKTHASQRQQADLTDSLYKSRLAIGIAKGALQGLKIELKSLEVGFEEWRTKMVNAREERKRYGA